MYVVHATFRLEGLTDKEYLDYCDHVAPDYAAIAGLHSKMWLHDPVSDRYGAVYVYESRAAYDELRQSDFFARIAATPFVRDVQSSGYDVIDGPTIVTRGPSNNLRPRAQSR
jgi:hypothetical protein